MQVTFKQIQAVVDPIDFTDGSHAYDEAAPGILAVANDAAREALQAVLDAVQRSGAVGEKEVRGIAEEMGVSL